MPNPVVHFEIGCRDREATSRFFSNLFGWSIDAQGPASTVFTGESGSAAPISGHIASLGHEPHYYVTVYVQVHDVQEYMDKAATLGGKALLGPVPIPTGRFAWIADPDGNIIGLLSK